MYSYIDTSKAHDIANEVIPILEDAGYSVEEMIAGLIQGVVDLAHGSEPLLDDAANFLADGGD